MAKSTEDENASVSRRDLFHIIGSVPVLTAVAAPGLSLAANVAKKTDAHAAATKGSYTRKTFDDHQWQTVHVLCDLIIPADERSGSASDAGVPEFLDDWIAFRTEQDGNQNFQAEMLGGLMWLDRESNRLCQKDFAAASADNQKQLLDRIAYDKKVAPSDVQGAAFFRQFRSLTVSGFFSSKMGVADLPYLGNVAVAEWKGCDPKVWAILEERMKNGYNGILQSKPWSTNS